RALMRSKLLLAVVVALAWTPVARGQVTQPAPASATMRLTFVDGSNRPVDAAFPGQGLRVLGIVKPYIGGQTVVVSFGRGQRLLAARSVRVVSGGHNTGRFIAQIPVGRSFGFSVTVEATHAAT